MFASRFRYSMLLTVAALGLSAPAYAAVSAVPVPACPIKKLHDSFNIIDSHVDIPFNFATPVYDPGKRDIHKANLVRLREGGVDGVFFVVFVEQGPRTAGGYADVKAAAMRKFNGIHRMAETLYPDRVGLVHSAAEARQFLSQGKLAAFIGIENGYAIGKDLSLLKTYYDLGARYITLTHNGNNDIGDSAQPQARWDDPVAEFGGLSPFGRSVVTEMNRLGIMVDLSHTSKQTMMEAVAMSRAPVLLSHSSIHALVNHPRNVDDEQLAALKANGGVLQITAVDEFVHSYPPERKEAIEALRQRLGLEEEGDAESLAPASVRRDYENGLRDIEKTWPAATVKDLADHIDYAVKKLGVDHVGVASDFDGGGGVQGWNSADETCNVTVELMRRGYSADDLKKIWGGNILRLLEEVEQVASKLQKQAN